MKLETILNAYTLAVYYMEDCEKHTWEYYNRQYRAFRSRILKMDADKDKRIDVLRAEHDFLLDGSRELKAELDEKDQMIRDMAWLTYCDQVTDTGMTEHIIGHGKEYADMKDWMESYINELRPRPEEAQDV